MLVWLRKLLLYHISGTRHTPLAHSLCNVQIGVRWKQPCSRRKVVDPCLACVLSAQQVAWLQKECFTIRCWDDNTDIWASSWIPRIITPISILQSCAVEVIYKHKFHNIFVSDIKANWQQDNYQYNMCRENMKHENARYSNDIAIVDDKPQNLRSSNRITSSWYSCFESSWRQCYYQWFSWYFNWISVVGLLR